ncbi:hypothetical protein CHS0354_019975 [Potamilus streckersoni]|uniref:Uncharacterized protein n=1 Tax=Potamilus streckersoni TaxID=2493646 RepID=A0AAE0S7N2_9BIVA|nr:hypothetical protein CHS0354_019975 [Potamilus streckersoni]
MNKEHREILRRSRVKIVEDLIIEEIWDKLEEKEVFTPMMIEYIKAEKTRPDQVRKLIDDLQRRGPLAYSKFMDCLKEGGHAHLANFISNKEAEIYGRSLPYTEEQTFRTSPSEKSFQSAEPKPSQFHVQETSIIGVGDAGQNKEDARGEVEAMDNSEDIDQNDSIPIQNSEMEGDAIIYSVPPSSSLNVTSAGYTGRADQYKMESSPRGLVLIINNRNFWTLSCRPGTEHDGKKLGEMFVSLGFLVDEKNDLTALEISQNLENLSKYPQLATVDSLVVVILSHGKENDTVLGVDGSVLTYNKITEPFNSKNCPVLHNKPKLFIINACRGDAEDIGCLSTSVQPDRVDADIMSLDSRPEVTVSYNPSRLPILQDMIIAASTLPGHVSWRDDHKGSWFIQAIVEVFQNHSRTHHVTDLLVRVNGKVAQNLHQDRVQLPEPRVLLVKDWFLNPI